MEAASEEWRKILMGGNPHKIARALDEDHSLITAWVEGYGTIFHVIARLGIESAISGLTTTQAPEAFFSSYDDDGQTPLHWAARRGYVNIARWLVNQGAVIDLTNDSKETPLHLSCVSDMCLPITQLLVAHGASLKARDARGDTALHIASAYDQPMTIEFLMSKGSNPRTKNHSRNRPLHPTLFAWQERNLEERMLIWEARKARRNLIQHESKESAGKRKV